VEGPTGPGPVTGSSGTPTAAEVQASCESDAYEAKFIAESQGKSAEAAKAEFEARIAMCSAPTGETGDGTETGGDVTDPKTWGDPYLPSGSPDLDITELGNTTDPWVKDPASLARAKLNAGDSGIVGNDSATEPATRILANGEGFIIALPNQGAYILDENGVFIEKLPHDNEGDSPYAYRRRTDKERGLTGEEMQALSAAFVQYLFEPLEVGPPAGIQVTDYSHENGMNNYIDSQELMNTIIYLRNRDLTLELLSQINQPFSTMFWDPMR
jgi:hypothetical protein